METGSVGIENNFSVFIQPTLESMILKRKEELKLGFYDTVYLTLVTFTPVQRGGPNYNCCSESL